MRRNKYAHNSMSFPKFKNKHFGKPVTKLYTNHFNYPKDLPRKIIIIYDYNTEQYLKKKYSLKKKTSWNVPYYDLYLYKNIGIAKMNGFGSPHAILGFEDLISRGGREFLNIGFAGGLGSKGLYLIEKALRDEGTSHHYDKAGLYSYPDKNLSNNFKDKLKEDNLNPDEGSVWTVDAPLMETKEEVSEYMKKGIKCVDMEISALYTVAKIRNVKIASALVVSDILGKSQKLIIENFDTQKAMRELAESSIDFFLSR